MPKPVNTWNTETRIYTAYELTNDPTFGWRAEKIMPELTGLSKDFVHDCVMAFMPQLAELPYSDEETKLIRSTMMTRIDGLVTIYRTPGEYPRYFGICRKQLPRR